MSAIRWISGPRARRVRGLRPGGATDRLGPLNAVLQSAEARSSTEAGRTLGISAFAEAYPEITPELDFSDRLVDVIDEGFDAVMRTGKVANSNLRMRALGTYGRVRSNAVVGGLPNFA